MSFAKCKASCNHHQQETKHFHHSLPECLCAILCNQPLPFVVNSPVTLNPEKHSIPIVLPLSECM